MDILALKDKELEIVGFDGAMVSDCGSALPLVHQVGANVYFARASSLDPNMSRPVFNEDELNEYVAEGRVTRLPEAIHYSADSLAVFVKPSVSEAIGHDFGKKEYHWQELQNGTYVTCFDSTSAYALLDSFAERLMAKAEALLGPLTVVSAGKYDSADREKVIQETIRLTRIAVVTARDIGLREHVCIRYGLAISLSAEPKRLINVYRFMVAKNFPNLSYDDYQRDIELLEYRLKELYEKKN